MNLSNQLFLFWKIGKKVYEDQNCYYNVIQKYSEYYSYYFGNSSLFTRERIHLMKRFYMNYPIYAYQFNSFSWDQVQILLQITNKKERQFYFHLSLLFQCDLKGTLEFIHNRYYYRI